MRHDYKFLTDQSKQDKTVFRPEKSHLILFSAIAVGLVLGFSLLPKQAGANKEQPQTLIAKRLATDTGEQGHRITALTC